MDTVGFSSHDHHACIASNLTTAENRCAELGIQLTAVRRRVLEILLEEHRALGAYDILETLKSEGLGAQPPVAYRALDFLVKNGFAHKIERLNAFVACAHPDEDHAPAFLICRMCDSVAETQVIHARGTVGETADAIGFKVEKVVVEAEGVCPNCQGKAA